MAETITTDNKSTLLYRFLVSPELRWARYLVLIMVLATISFNQVFIIFLDYRDILGGWIYTFTFLYLLTYIGVIYLNLFWLFPKFLLKRRYLTYISLLSVAMMLALAIQMATEYVSYSCWPEFYERASYFSIPIVMDYISSFMLSTLCMIGGTMTVLLKEWMIDHQRVSQMEKVHVLSEVEQLKEQVSPELLFKTLHHSGELTLSEPEFNYELLADGEVNRTLVPPLLFIPFVQYIVKSINEQRTSIPVSLKIHLKVEENTIIFTCLCQQVNLLENKGLERIRQRLNLLYGNRYRLFLTTESIWLELKGGEV